MSNQIKLNKEEKLLCLYSRLNELDEAKGLIGNTTYYIGRRRVLMNNIETLVRDILGLSKPVVKTPKRVTTFEDILIPRLEREEISEASLTKELVTEYSENELSALAKIFGVEVPSELKEREQYLVTTVMGLLSK